MGWTTAQYRAEEKRRSEGAHRSAIAKVERDNALRGQRERDIQRASDTAAMAREQAKIEAGRPAAEAQRDYWAAKAKQEEFNNYMDRAKAKKKGFALPGEERGGIAGSSESWKEEQPPSGTARITDEATGKVYEDLPEYSEVSAKSLLAGPTRSRASQVMTPPTDRAWEQGPVPKKRPRWHIPVEKTVESLYNVNDLIFGGVNRAGSKLYDWLTESVARP